jgi:chromosome segregation ATPase
MKNSRNRLANLTQSYSQACAEMKEKIKILTNEVDILRNESMARDKLLAEEIRRHQSKQNARDQLKIELNRNKTQVDGKQGEEKQQGREIEKLNSIVNRTEKQMSDLRKAYAQAVDNRNLTGIQVIDRYAT